MYKELIIKLYKDNFIKSYLFNSEELILPFLKLELKEEKEKNNLKEDITVFDVIRKTKKIHLFYIQPVLNDFIDTKEKDIKNLVKDIFIEITNIIGMPKLTNFNK